MKTYTEELNFVKMGASIGSIISSILMLIVSFFNDIKYIKILAIVLILIGIISIYFQMKK